MKLLRVAYSKKDLPKELREYQINGSGAVGTLKEKWRVMNMGKDYTPIKLNGMDLKAFYKKIRGNEVIEASELKYFNVIPTFNAVEEIEIGTNGTKECIIRLKDEGFAVVKGTLKLNGG